MNRLKLNNYKQEIADLYTRRSDKYDRSTWHQKIAHSLVEQGQVNVGQKVLDIATGTGHCAFFAANLVGEIGEVIGIDIAPGMIEQAQNKAEEMNLNNIKFLLADAENLIFESNYFDRIFCASAFIWMSDLVGSLLHWRNFLKPGGIIGIQAFAETAFVGGVIAQQVSKKYGIDYLMSKPTGTVEKCQNLLKKANLELVEIKVEQNGNYISLEEATRMWAGSTHPAPGQYPSPLSKLSIEQLEQAKLEFEQELEALQTDKGIWNDITTFYIYGRKPMI